ncbi:MAG: hypothetical protein P794_03750 [Epsilonproteobacteria bacterium (ex Lamellibrachia satsuma)]|nr:MAG: hypothetical protein P794_03750 [Epsilonproteobacteria bacterium (ex Lamellibrachia satsuma)]
MKQLVLILMLIWLSGCSNKQAPLKIYTLNAQSDVKISQSKFRQKTIKVSYPQSLKSKIGEKMYYSYNSMEEGAYQNSQWSNNIGKLLQGTFIEAIEQSKLFKAVLPYTSTAGEDYRLESTIFAFSHQVRGKQSHALVSIQFALIDTNTGRLIKTKYFSYRVPTKTIDAKGYVEATNVAINRLSKDLVQWLR